MIRGLHHISMKCQPGEELARVREFYLDLLGCSVRREWDGGLMIDLGNTLLEVFTNGTGSRVQGAIRHMAFAVDDVDAAAQRIREAGYDVFIGPRDIEIRSDPVYPARVSFCTGPLGEEIELFQER